MAGHLVQDEANGDPRSSESAQTRASVEPVTGSPIEFASKNDSEGDIIQAAIASLGSVASIGKAISGGKRVEEKEASSSTTLSSNNRAGRDVIQNVYLSSDEPAGSTRREWIDPSKPIQLPPPLEIDGASLHHAVEQLRSRRILVIECIDSDVQRRIARRVVDALGCERKMVEGVATDAAYAEGPGGTTSGEERSRWTIESIEHPDLGEGASVLVLEVEGAVGSNLIDKIFASRGSMDALGTSLTQLTRYLILLPRGRATDALFRGHARRGFAVHPLRISFLRPWLDKRFPEHAAHYEAALRAQIARGDWVSDDAPRGQPGGNDEPMPGGERALYEWLCSLPTDQRGEEQLRQALVDGVGEPRPVTAVRDALEREDGADELLLTTVFVAAYLPGLTQYDFFRTVETLLADRTRTSTPPTGPNSGQNAPPATVEISLVSDWRRTVRSVMRTADLELRATAEGPKIVCFRAARAPIRVKDLLGCAPMFLESQLEHLYRSELLFDRSRAISQAVTDFVSAIAAEDPGRLNARWMLGLLIRSRPDTQHVPYLPETSELHDAEWIARHLDCAHRLLRRLINVGPDPELTGHTAGGLVTVNGVLDHLLFRMSDGPAELGLALAYRLRDAPAFDIWHWIRQAMERGRDPVKAGADELVRRLVGDRAESHAALERLFAWLPSGAQPPNGAARIAARSIAKCLVASLRYTPSVDAARMPALTELLCKASIRGGDRQQISDIVTACFHPQVCALAISSYGLDAWLTSLLLPDRATVGDRPAGESRTSDLGATWTEVTQALLSGFEEHELAAQLPVALVLALWGHAHASQPAVAQSLALAVRDQFVDGRPAIQVWLGTFDDVMSRCEDLAMSDRTADRAATDRWVQASMTKRQVFLDLQRWIAHGVAEGERVWMS